MRAARSVAIWLACGCAAAGGSLPSAPPPRSASELVLWQTPPPLVLDPELHVAWNIEQRRLGSGLDVNAISRPGTTLTSIALWLPSAAALGGAKVAVLVQALRAGTRARSGAVLMNPELARQPISARTTGTGSVLGWQVLPAATELALELLADFVAHPAFDPVETRGVLDRQLATIRRASVGSEHLVELARGRVPGIDVVDPESQARELVRLTPERLADARRCTLTPRGAELVIVGPASTRDLLAWSEGAFASFSTPPLDAGCEEWRRAAPAAPPVSNARIELSIVRGGTSPPTVVIVNAGPAPESDEFLPFLLLSQVLDSRASAATELRHVGATYGVHARVNEGFPGRSLLELEGQLAPGNAQAALRALVENLQGLSETLQAPELEEVKRRWRNGFINSMSSNVAVAQQTLWEVRRGHPAPEVQELPNELARISLERCREVARQWLAGAAPSIAVAGLPVGLVRGLGFEANIHEQDSTERLQQHDKAL